MGRPTVVVCIDGFDPEYLQVCETPVLKDLGARGFFRIGRAMMPSVTNVNNVSLVTGRYPADHGICSNYRYMPESGEEMYVESGRHILAQTMFQRAATQGKTSVLVTSKDKLRTLLAEGASVAVSAEQPPDWVVRGVGEPPGVYTLEVNAWVVRAAGYVMSRRPTDLVYVTTTDYAMHTFAPEEPESRLHLSLLDDALGALVQAHPEAAVLVTADHGMSTKSRMVDLGEPLARRGIRARVVPVIKDRYVVHHSNLGGCAFVYLESGDPDDAGERLRAAPGVEQVMGREEAAASLRLHPDHIGDLVVTGDPRTVFGNPAEVAMPPRLRSHGSPHERAVPIVGFNGDFDGFAFEENRDVGRYVFERVLA